MKIGIVGSRRRDTLADKAKVAEALLEIVDKYDLEPEDVIIVSGGCPKGADRFAEEFVKAFGLPDPIIHLPNKDDLDPVLLEKNPRAAYAVINFARNTLIANDSNELIACVAPDRSGGTEDTIRKFLKRMPKEKLHLC